MLVKNEGNISCMDEKELKNGPYYEKDGKYYHCFENCKKCTDKDVCNECVDGYDFLNSDFSKCVIISVPTPPAPSPANSAPESSIPAPNNTLPDNAIEISYTNFYFIQVVTPFISYEKLSLDTQILLV